MNHTSAIITVMALSLTALPLFAGPDEAEFLQLREKRDRALADAARPINEQYKAALEALLRRAIAHNDKNTAPIIQFELQSLNGSGTASLLPTRTLPLQAQLAETKWRLTPDKTFVLHAGGTSTSNWTPRPGNWKVVGANTLELSIWNVARTEKVSLDQGATLMTWLNKEADQPHPLVAKKIVSESTK